MSDSPTVRVKLQFEIANAPDGVDQDLINELLHNYMHYWDEGRYNFEAEVISQALNNVFSRLVKRSVSMIFSKRYTVYGYSEKHRQSRNDWINNKVDDALKEMEDRRFIRNNYRHLLDDGEEVWLDDVQEKYRYKHQPRDWR
tara:strand:- start:2446 stop:2871 length:426 start_codon:yes stop_codon:yes gene_type:complete